MAGSQELEAFFGIASECPLSRCKLTNGLALQTAATSITDGGSVSWDCKMKESTPRLAPGRPQPPAMGFDNRAADREAHAHAVGLRRVEGFKETRQALRAQPMAGIPHRDAHATLGRDGIDADL